MDSIAKDNRETGVNPVRTRHCDRGVYLNIRHWATGKAIDRL